MNSPSPTRTPGRRRPRVGSAALALVAALVLAACGPGVGGTGTGNEALSAYGATAASACTAPFASALGCSTSPGGAVGAPGVGTAPRVWADTDGPSRVQLRLEGDSATLELRCAGRRFDGQWGTQPSLGARYYGELVGTGGSPAPVFASLTVQAEQGNLVVVLQAIDGSTVAGPLTLRPAAGATPAAVCP